MYREIFRELLKAMSHHFNNNKHLLNENGDLSSCLVLLERKPHHTQEAIQEVLEIVK